MPTSLPGDDETEYSMTFLIEAWKDYTSLFSLQVFIQVSKLIATYGFLTLLGYTRLELILNLTLTTTSPRFPLVIHPTLVNVMPFLSMVNSL